MDDLGVPLFLETPNYLWQYVLWFICFLLKFQVSITMVFSHKLDLLVINKVYV